MSWDSYFAFVSVAIALAIVPGPTVTVIIANSLRYGTRAGLANVVGTQVGFLIWLGVAAVGLSAAIAVMGVWFDVIRYLGAAYLIYLGIKMLMAKGKLAKAEELPPSHGSFMVQGFVVIISNPKMLVLFGAVIPPFLTQGGSIVQETLLLGLTFMLIASLTDAAYALLAGQAGSWMTHSRIRVIEIISGLFLAMGGLWLALRGR